MEEHRQQSNDDNQAVDPEYILGKMERIHPKRGAIQPLCETRKRSFHTMAVALNPFLDRSNFFKVVKHKCNRKQP
ncbi:hypothetical protein D3C78_805950 [compost metagenome]